MRLTLGQIADWIHAEGDFTTKTEAVGYSIDSRTGWMGTTSSRRRWRMAPWRRW
jgi:hypothetical protein